MTPITETQRGILFGFSLMAIGILYLLAEVGVVLVQPEILTAAALILFAGILAAKFMRTKAIINLVAAAALSFVGLAMIIDETRIVDDQFIGVLLFCLVGAALTVGYLRNSEIWGLIIPAGISFSLALVVLLDLAAISDEMTAVALFLGFSATFFMLYHTHKGRNQFVWAKLTAVLFVSLALSYFWQPQMVG